ncbi:sentan [Pantherophis guttatus]|uniref:Sentan n=1 Tax=Pantherophis guttatus TaxID=94885 RepID=A0A6P9B9L1_PANGU|nr:sentan [Pantherophis guttatus]
MCGCTSSRESTSYSLDHSNDVSSTKVSKKTLKRVPISKQLASIKGLGKSSDLEKAVATAALVYDNAADAEGKLSKCEAKKLLLIQFMHFIQGQETKPKYQEMMSALDENKNDKIDFEDFMVHVVSLTLMSDLRQEIQNVQKSK